MSEQAISVLLPIHNGAKYLPELIPNLLSNCRPYDEIIVISDGSTDATNSMLRKASKEFPQIVFIEQDHSGLVQTLNNGISIAKNDWIARFDADDYCSNNRLETQRREIGEDRVAIFADYSLYSMHDRFLGTIPSAIFPSAMKFSLISGNRTAHPVVIFNKKAAQQVGCYRAADFLAEDLALWMKLSEVGEIISVPDILLNYRLTKTSITRTNRERSQKVRDELIKEFSRQLDVRHSLEIFNETQKLYMEHALGPERSILHLKDIFQILELQPTKRAEKKQAMHELAKLACSLEFTSSIAQLAYFKLKRIAYYKF